MYNSQSINDRLKNIAKKEGFKNIEKARIILCLERVIARLVIDKYLQEHLIFGGGFVLYKEAKSQRFTKDVDAIISGINNAKLIEKIVNCLKSDLNDGFWFGNSIIEELKTESGYGGLRFKIQYKAGLPFPNAKEMKALRRVHLDISIGVNLEKYAIDSTLTPILEIYDSIEWKVYPIEFICAEKIHCLLDRKDLNTRGKDIYDLDFLLSRSQDKKLIEAIQKTFLKRKFKIKSLHNTAIKIDTTNLKENFRKAQFKKINVDFHQCWNNILNRFKILDQANNKHIKYPRSKH